MKNILKIILFALIGTVVMYCQMPPVKYVTVKPPAFQIPEGSQPLKIIVKDERTDKKLSENEIMVEQFPEQRMILIMKERLAANNIKYGETENKGELIVSIKAFSVKSDGGYWNAQVLLSFSNELRTQNVETKIKLYNALGTRDAVKALSQALSAAIDDVKWSEFFPG